MRRTNMREITLSQPLKLVNINSQEHPLGTKFIYTLPSFVLDFDGLEVIANLKEGNILQYQLCTFFEGFISDPKFNREFILNDLEQRLVSFKSHLQVRMADSYSKAFLIEKNGELNYY